MTEQLPRFEGPCIIVLIGPAGSGKSTWAAAQFPGEAVLSSDELRRWLTDDAEEQSCSKDAFAVLNQLADLRLKYGRRVIVDATNVKHDARRVWWELARAKQLPCAAIWFDVPLDVCIARQQRRARKVSPNIIERQRAEGERLLQSRKHAVRSALPQVAAGRQASAQGTPRPLGAARRGALARGAVQRPASPHVHGSSVAPTAAASLERGN